MLTISEDRVREVFAKWKLPILHLSLVNDEATHDKWNVITQISGRRTARFVWDEESLEKEALQLYHDRGEEAARLRVLDKALNTSTMLQPRPLLSTKV